MYNITLTKRFEEDYARCSKQGKDLPKLKEVVRTLADGKPLAKKHRDHPLVGNWVGRRECHIQPDWLMLYKLCPTEGDYQPELILERTGSHSELFK